MFRRRDTAERALRPAEPGRGRRAAPAAPSCPPTRRKDYLGQLDPAFQAALSKRREGADLSDFVWYHAFELPDGTVLPGVWDLRGHESAYLGGVDLAGKRVLELGPATGLPDLLHGAHGRRGGLLRGRVRRVRSTRCPSRARTSPRSGCASCRRPSTATTTPGGTCTAPWARRPSSSRGTSTTCRPISGPSTSPWSGAILLHLREPWGALSQAARRTTETMIVTEPLQDDLDPPESNIMRFSPSAEHHLTNWWSIYPGAVVSMLARLGFGQTETTMHSQRHYLAHDIESDAIDQRMYTVVGRPVS